MSLLVLAEKADGAAKLCAGARGFSDEVVLAWIGSEPAPTGVADRTIRIALPEAAVFDDAADTVNALFDELRPGAVFVEATKHLGVVAGKLAAHAGTSVITDVLELGDEGAVSMYFGGIAHRKVKATGFAVYTMNPEMFAGLPVSGNDVVEEKAWVKPAQALQLMEVRPIEKGDVDLLKAEIVVAAGRGFAEEEQLEPVREFSSKLGAGLGCSRPLAEGMNWFPQSLYIGVSGLMLAPKVYVAVGVSGQMQHMVGCNRAGLVFAVNKDKNAPIFKQCDYGLVGDIKDVLPALNVIL